MLNLAVQIAEAMNYLNEKGLVHKDLATRYVLFILASQKKIAGPIFLIYVVQKKPRHNLANDYPF